MIKFRATAALLGTVLLLAGCEWADNALLPTLGGSSSDTAKSKSAASSKVAAAKVNPADAGPKLGTGNFEPVPLAAIKPSATDEGKTLQGLYQNLAKLQASISSQNATLQSLRSDLSQNDQAYAQSLAAIDAKLAAGAAPGDATLVKQWNDAQARLQKGQGLLVALDALSSDVAINAEMAGRLSESAHAALAGAAAGEDAEAKELDDEASRTAILTDRFRSELADDISRQGDYQTKQRSRLTALAAAIDAGKAPAAKMANVGAPGSGIASGKPFVVIRFDKSNPDYEPALKEAVSKALAERPDAAFDLVAVAPEAAPEGADAKLAQANADQVLKSLMGMGLAPERVNMATATTSPTIKADEVDLYIR
jgi:hypothetical protein